MSTRSPGPSFDTRSGDLGMKRKRGIIQLNCNECRRLKLRCDRSVPCSSCVRRGCGAICPDGLLPAVQGNHPTNEELLEKNQQLSYRIRHLEEALRSLHSDRSTAPHPLLSEELLKIKTPLQGHPLPPRSSNTFILSDEITRQDVTGPSATVSVHNSGVPRYYGHTANSLYFLQNGQHDGTYVPDEVFSNLQTLLPLDILTRASMMPVSYCLVPDKANLQCLLPYLPARIISYELRTIFYTHASWMYNPIPEETFDKHIFSVFYGSGASVQLQPGDPSIAHKLSLVFMILAIGSLMDPSLPAYNMEAERYHQLARAALFQSSLFEVATEYAVQALFLMSFYLFLADRYGTTSEPRWVIMGIAVKIGQSIGLHRDSAQWNFNAAETQRRRELFWEIFTLDSWQSLTFGRPPSLPLSHIDCKPPFSDCGGGSNEKTFHAWKHRFTSECMSTLHEHAFGTKVPTYAAVLQLDQRICSLPVPPALRMPEPSNVNYNPVRYPVTIGLTLQRHIVSFISEMNRLYLHRSFFAQAIIDHPEDPFQSPYRDSVSEAYRCAQTFIRLMRNLHAQPETLCTRMWFLWTHMFSCSVILASIVIRCPSTNLAPAALAELESASELFSKVASRFRAVELLETMRCLQRKAQHSLTEYQQGGTFSSQLVAPYPGPMVGSNNLDEISTLRGNVCVDAKTEPIHPSGLQIPPSFQPPPQAFPQNVPEANLLPGSFPTPDKSYLSDTWIPIPQYDGSAADTAPAPFNMHHTSSTLSYRCHVTTLPQVHPPQNVNFATNFSVGTADHSYYGTPPIGFLKKQDGTFDSQDFPMDQWLNTSAFGESKLSPESSAGRIQSAWKDLLADLQLC